jgi:hypothetical protein
LVSTAVNESITPAHIVVLLALMLTVGTADETTDMVSEFDVTCTGFAQLALDVNKQLTTSPLVKPVAE